MMRTKPPFRADHVGSLLRSAAIKEAREKHENGGIDDNELREVENQEIPKIIRKQEEVGLKAITDGEYRRFQKSQVPSAASPSPTARETPSRPRSRGRPSTTSRCAWTRPVIGLSAYTSCQRSGTRLAG